MRDCTLCMDCAQSCEAVSFSIVKPMSGLTGEIKDRHNMHVWVFVLLIAVITITMNFHHALCRTPLKADLPWQIAGQWMASVMPFSIDWVGFNALWMAIVSVVFFVFGGFKIASVVAKAPFSDVTKNLAYALAPLMILGSFSHVGSFFFLHYASDLATAYYWLIGDGTVVKPLASFRDKWVHLFSLFGYLGAIASAVLLYIRLGRYKLTLPKRLLSLASAGAMVWFYLFLQWLQIAARS